MVRRALFSGYLGLGGLAVLAIGSGSCSTAPPASSIETAERGGPHAALQIKTLSNRADLISGGDALVEIVLPPRASPGDLRVRVGRRDATSAFAVRAGGRILGVIDGLAEGKNRVVAILDDDDDDHGHGRGRHDGYRDRDRDDRDRDDDDRAELVITNHKIGGPVLSGSQIQPFVCATPLARPASGDIPASNASGLSTEAIDDQCNIATEVKLFYRSSNPRCLAVTPDPNPPAVANPNACFKPFDPAAPPADLATTTTDTGATVPYIVRVERGTLNRGIYDIAVLFDPAADDVKTGWKAVAPQPGWNHKMVYSFGASSGQPRRQFRSEQSWADDNALSRGFLVAINSMTDSLFNDNRVAMTETLMMMKEKVIDSFGEVRYAIGNGCSGGSINQLTAASIHPGLLDGIQPTCTYPDSETTAVEVADCLLLVHFYNSPEWAQLTAGLTQDQINAKKAAIDGHVDQTGCHAWVNSFSNLGRPGNYVPYVVLDNVTGRAGPNPNVTTPINNCQLPASFVYDPVTNPNGARCTAADHAVSIWGNQPGTHRAVGTTDNVGVQYGLAALKAGAITAEEFVALNEVIGGVDADDSFTGARSEADRSALRTAYRAGIVSDARHLARVPIMDLRGYDDSNIPPPAGAFGIHHIWRSFALRSRLDTANRGHGNHVMWRYGTGLVAPAASGLTLQSLLTIDRWIAAVVADTSATSLENKIVHHRPADAFDFCYLTTDTAFANKVTDFAVCDTDRFLKPHSSPRQVAGGPLAENVLKCQLRSIRRTDYAPAVLTDAQLARLRAAFPDGVCDFARPGVEQQPAVSPLDFSDGPGGRQLPDAPESRSL
jgi:hypothetical protein